MVNMVWTLRKRKKILQKAFKVFDVHKPEEIEDFALFMENIDFALSTLDEREVCILNGRCKGKALLELSKTILRVEGDDPRRGINIERVRQIEKKAIKKLRHPLRLLILKGKVRTPEEYERLKKLKHEELLQML